MRTGARTSTSARCSWPTFRRGRCGELRHARGLWLPCLRKPTAGPEADLCSRRSTSRSARRQATWQQPHAYRHGTSADYVCRLPASRLLDAALLRGHVLARRLEGRATVLRGAPGSGGLTAYVEAARRQRVDLLRTIDRKTRAKTMFATSGIPGTVGSSACALWRELGPRLTTDREFALWPFEGDLPTLFKSHAIVLGEIYPRAAYATALLDGPPSDRPRPALAKTKPDVRQAAMARLRRVEWVHRYGVTIDNITDAEASEDDFDACVTAAALLRCVLEEQPLTPPGRATDQIEGGILGTGTINLDLPELTFGRSRLPVRNHRPRNRTGAAAPVRHGPATFACPIPGCDKVFSGSRGGWDGHVGSVRIHPQWHPELDFPETRRRQFETEFPEFFGLR